MSQPPDSGERGSTDRPSSRPLFWLALLLLFYGMTEGLAYVTYTVATRSRFHFGLLDAERDQWRLQTNTAFGLDDVPTRYRIRREVLHPYLGFVHDPTVDEDLKASPFGISDVDPVQKRSPGKVIVGFFGGSFAEDVAYTAAGKMIEELTPLYPGKDIVVVKGAMGGYKQPQQLMAYNYFSALGGEFDIIVNLDGFNEIVLPAVENMPSTSPYFPRQWNMRLKMVPDAALLSTIGEIKFLDTASQKWLNVFAHTPLRYSVTMNVIWWAGERFLYNRATTRRASLPSLAARSNEFASSGPPTHFKDDAEMYASLAGVWEESSYQMHALAASKGARYFHFLQPNQYIEGSKPMTPAEREIAIGEGPYAKIVQTNYPLLQTLGKDLQARGVAFVDLTMIFKDNRAVLYGDNCCHVNSAGADLVAAAMGRAVAEGLRRERAR